ncbi:MAG: aminotransferase class III-fold pyridoxal phosphate-dependent enzyme, partial [Alicyclobacillus herbarius]|nr:aminotransferase class III-fold pyridoxal phosphate-dependent enzyme [Alicyclobacillus herbarius]
MSNSAFVNTAVWAEEDYRRYIPKGVSVQNPVCIVRAEGARMWDDAGQDYLDFAGGIGCLNIGSAHPEVVQVVQEQAAKLFHTCI